MDNYKPKLFDRRDINCGNTEYCVQLKPINLNFPLHILVCADSHFQAMEEAFRLINYIDLDPHVGINAIRI